MADEKEKIGLEAVFDVKNFQQGLSTYNTGLGKAVSTTTNTASKFSSLGSGIGKLGAGIAIVGGAIAGATAFLASCAQEAMEAEIVMSKLTATLRATGRDSEFSAKQLSLLAGAMSEKTAIDDEAIMSAQSVLLTYSSIGEDVFPRATQATIDMAVAMNGGSGANVDLAGTARLLGKSLEDPTKGMTALTRQGVTFTEQQKSMIKSFMDMGQLANAQEIVLEGLMGKYAGAAEAWANTTAGHVSKLSVAWSNIKESVGGLITPLVEGGADLLAGLKYISTPAIELYGGETIQILTDVENEMRGRYKNYENYINDFNKVVERSTIILGGHVAENGDLVNSSGEIIIKSLVATRTEFYMASKEVETFASQLLRTNEVIAQTADTTEDWMFTADEQIAKSIVNVGVTGKLNQIWETHAQTMERLNIEQAELNKQIEDNTKWYGADSAQVANLNAKLEENNQAQIKATQTARDATAQFVYQTIAAQLDAEGALALARGMGILDENTYNAAVTTQQIAELYQSGAISANEMAGMVGALTDKVVAANGKYAYMTVDTYYNEYHTSYYKDTKNPVQIGANKEPVENASGADFTVPPGYSNDSFYYPQLLSSGERLIVLTKEQQEKQAQFMNQLLMEAYASRTMLSAGGAQNVFNNDSTVNYNVNASYYREQTAGSIARDLKLIGMMR